MNRVRNTMVGRGLFGLGVLGALAFGASQAAAAPTSNQKTASCTYIGCRNMCIAAGYSRGFCDPLYGFCSCD